MATTLPGSPPAFDKENTAGTVRAVCNYLRTLHESVDFQLGQFRKALEAQQTAIETLTEKSAGQGNELAALRQGMETLQDDYDKLAARVSALE